MLYLHANANRTHMSFEQLRQTGQALFYRVCTSVTSMNMLFPAGAAAYEACLKRLGQVSLIGLFIIFYRYLLLIIHTNNLILCEWSWVETI